MQISNTYIRAIIDTIIPDATGLTVTNFREMLAKKSPAMQKQFKLFLSVIRLVGFLRFGNKFEKLSSVKRTILLASFETALIGKIRLGFWGLRSMVLLSHYGTVKHSSKIGFLGPTKNSFPSFNKEPQDPYTPQVNFGKTTKLAFDIVIIGSGAGGGVVAERLTPLLKKGLKIAVLESGANYQPKAYFNQQELQMSRLFWEDGGLLNKEGTMTLAAARMVGGSTGVYTGVTFDLPEEVFSTWGLDMSYTEFQTRLLKQRKAFNTHKLSKEYINYNNELFKKGAKKCKLEVLDLELSTKECQGAGFCNLGCVNDAKMSSLNVQLPVAEEAGIELIANCHVNTISEGKIMATIYPSPKGTKGSNYALGEYEITAKQIIVAAGCYGTNALLSRSNLDKCGTNLGKYVTMHPTVTLYGKHPDLVEGFKNFPKAYYVNNFSETENHIIETAFYYPGITSKNLEGWGSTHQKRMQSYANFMCAIVLNHDKAEERNSIYWDGNRPVLDYHISDSSLESLRMGQIRTAQLFFAAGCDEVYTPFAKGGMVKVADKENLFDLISLTNYTPNKTVFASAHPQGGCSMGGKEAVCDNRGRLRGYNNIYVADASLFPSSSHVNPFLTVMALADMVADAVIEDNEKN